MNLFYGKPAERVQPDQTTPHRTILAGVWLVLSAGFLSCASTFSAMGAGTSTNSLAFDSISKARFEFTDPVGERARANTEHWLLCAPQANPGMLEMFRMRDRKPEPKLVPWAGEFVGKYLISAIQALRISADLKLSQQVSNVVSELIATQSDDGYLGPFPKDDRLLKYWDLWGHYHAIQALLLYNEYSGDSAALGAARKAGDLVCKTYLDSGKRVFDAGEAEMNMSILTGMAALYRITGEPRYLRMAQEVETDWERAGDYTRSALRGQEFYQSPKPRWESLCDLQGLVELWRITGDQKYREAFEHHWRSIRRWDRRNTGGFSSRERATGNPYAPTAIETCCTVAWMALTTDYLKLTGDPQAADELELSTLNAGLGAQHPSGRWCTYNTPMDGIREASAHTIVFQARAGTPELNCCSVNGPRVISMLSDWAIMKCSDGIVINWLGAGRFACELPDGTPITVASSSPAWLTGRTELQIETSANDPFTICLRIPSWAVAPRLLVNGQETPDVTPGDYARLDRKWSKGDKLELSFEMPVRFVSGANEAVGKASLYRGPLLLAYDQAQNAFDEDGIPLLELRQLREARVVGGLRPPATGSVTRPWLILEVPTDDGRVLRLVDFASAGAAGAHYRSWLAVKNPLPAPAFTQLPADGARVPLGEVRFQWRRQGRAPAASAPGLPTGFRVEFAANAAFAPLLLSTNGGSDRITLDTAGLSERSGGKFAPVFWRVVSLGPNGETIADVPPARFIIDPTVLEQALPPEVKAGVKGELTLHSLRDDAIPQFGKVKSAKYSNRGPEGTELNGRDQILVYELPAWPQEDFTVAVRVRVNELPRDHMGQIFSAWTGTMDDPLRLVVEKGKVYARIESGASFSTAGVRMERGRWQHFAAVKRGATLTLFVNGQEAGSCTVPVSITTQATDFALGGNPHFSGNEFLAARFADLAVFARALSLPEIQELAGKGT